MRHHIFYRPVEIKMRSSDMLFAQTCEQFFPAFKLLSQRGENMIFHAHHWMDLKFQDSVPTSLKSLHPGWSSTENPKRPRWLVTATDVLWISFHRMSSGMHRRRSRKESACIPDPSIRNMQSRL